MRISTSLRRQSYLLSLVLLLALSIAPLSASAQSVDLGADLFNRYVWRGLDFGESASVQPYLEVSAGNFTVGTWASYAVNAGGANEHDLYVSYSAGPLSFGVTDYYFPSPLGTPATAGSSYSFFDYSDGGAHTLEANLGYEGTGFALAGNINFFNDDDTSVYVEVGVPLTLGETELALAVGVVPMESAWYLTDGFAVTNISLGAGREIKITDAFSLPLSVAYTINPALERSYLVFGISL
ncbi:MAG: hypothetical protein AAGJ10_15470 [Bacteroidota bacterium]